MIAGIGHARVVALVAVALLVLASPSRGTAQTEPSGSLCACEESWLNHEELSEAMDVELAGVEQESRGDAVDVADLRVAECTTDAAVLLAEWSDGTEARWRMDLTTVEQVNRLRVVAIVFAELVRLGREATTATPPDLELLSVSLPAAAEDELQLTVEEEPEVADEDEQEVEPLADPIQRFGDVPAEEEQEEQLQPDTEEPVREPIWDLFVEGGVRGFLEYVTFTPFARARFRYGRVFGDVRVMYADIGNPEHLGSAGSVTMTALTAGFGVRVIEYRLPLLLALEARAEAGPLQMRGDDFEGVFGNFEGGSQTGFFGAAFVAARLEWAPTVLRFNAELEVGYALGMRTRSEGKEIAAHGFSLGLTLGVGI